MATSKQPNSAPPRGVQVVQWTNGDGSTTTKFRVRISRKNYTGKRNNYFDNLKEATSFLALSKLEKGKELIYSISEEERLKAKQEAYEDKLGNDFSFNYVAQRYITDEVYKNIDINDKIAIKQLPELKRRNLAMKRAFINIICNTSIPDRYITYAEKEELAIEHEKTVYRKFGKFDIRNEISKIDINNYIRARLKFVKPVSVAREITFISNVYNYLEYIDEAYEDIENVALKYNKSLLKDNVNYRKRILSEEEEQKFLDVINSYSNKELADICKISLLTSMRRSEIINLKKSQVQDDCRIIKLKNTKNGKDRNVFLDEEAREFFKNLEPATEAKEDRYFTYTIMGFGRVFAGLMKKNNLQDIHFHDLRRTKVSKMLSKGGENTLLVAKLLGFSSHRKFEEIHGHDNSNMNTQQGITNSNGHSLEIAYKHYLNPVLTEVDKLTRIKELKEKKKLEELSLQEEKELLKLLLEIID